ncbi:MAG: hypothetical protein LBT97_13340 [Planctomycetota bacterium]|nr:hypothetical protein [Planctomycetota bacterium]
MWMQNASSASVRWMYASNSSSGFQKVSPGISDANSFTSTPSRTLVQSYPGNADS